VIIVHVLVASTLHPSLRLHRMHVLDCGTCFTFAFDGVRCGWVSVALLLRVLCHMSKTIRCPTRHVHHRRLQPPKTCSLLSSACSVLRLASSQGMSCVVVVVVVVVVVMSACVAKGVCVCVCVLCNFIVLFLGMG